MYSLIPANNKSQWAKMPLGLYQAARAYTSRTKWLVSRNKMLRHTWLSCQACEEKWSQRNQRPRAIAWRLGYGRRYLLLRDILLTLLPQLLWTASVESKGMRTSTHFDNNTHMDYFHSGTSQQKAKTSCLDSLKKTIPSE